MPRLPSSGINKPKWSLYNLKTNQEHNLIQSFLMEYTDIAGIKIEYWRRKSNTVYDPLYGESTGIEFDQPIETKVIYDVGEEPNLWSSFGMFGGDIITCQMPQGTWKRDVSQTSSPNIGDVIRIPWLDREFEIVHVDDDDKIFQLKKMIYIFILRPFRFSEQSDSASQIYTETVPMSGFGDNEWIETQSDIIDRYGDVDKIVYG